jgi:hypothetical protein
MYVMRRQRLHLFDILHKYLFTKGDNSYNADTGAGVCT